MNAKRSQGDIQCVCYDGNIPFKIKSPLLFEEKFHLQYLKLTDYMQSQYKGILFWEKCTLPSVRIKGSEMKIQLRAA
jgi:hypothetical protein